MAAEADNTDVAADLGFEVIARPGESPDRAGQHGDGQATGRAAVRLRDGRKALRELHAARPGCFGGDVGQFLQAVDRHAAALEACGLPQPDLARIWTSLNGLDDAQPDWPARLADGAAGREGATAPSIQHWEAFTSWASFRQELLRAAGGRPLSSVPSRQPAEKARERGAAPAAAPAPTPAPTPAEAEAKAETPAEPVVPPGRYRVPGKKLQPSRRQLKDASKRGQRAFFRSRFPGRASCAECLCAHPIADGYAYCSNCDFCHKGGVDECYDLHPELRATRPIKTDADATMPEDGEEPTPAPARGPAEAPLDAARTAETARPLAAAKPKEALKSSKLEKKLRKRARQKERKLARAAEAATAADPTAPAEPESADVPVSRRRWDSISTISSSSGSSLRSFRRLRRAQRKVV